MPRSIWNGVISFGMVSIPVSLYTATESKDISFRLLHKKDGSRLKQLRWCPTDDAEVEWSDIVRGYEYEKDQHVVLTDDDFAKLPLPSKHTIDLNAFVRAEEIDSIYYEKSYFLQPGEAGQKPYALLMRALQEKGLLAVAKIAIRNKERLCALRPRDGALVLETLFFPDEIRTQQTSDSPEPEISDKELAMANSLLDILRNNRPTPPSRLILVVKPRVSINRIRMRQTRAVNVGVICLVHRLLNTPALRGGRRILMTLFASYHPAALGKNLIYQNTEGGDQL